MKKRGLKRAEVDEQAFFMLMEVMIVVVAMIAILSLIDSYDDNTQFEKKYFSKDVALFLDTIYSVPGNIAYAYFSEVPDISMFDYAFRDNSVIVSEQGKHRFTSEQYRYMKDSYYTESFEALHAPTQLYFQKNGDGMMLGDYSGEVETSTEFMCETVDTSSDSKTILLDPGKGESSTDDGIVEDQVTESDTMVLIALSVPTPPTVNLVYTRPHDSVRLAWDDRKEIIKKNMVTISLHMSQESMIKAYISNRYTDETIYQKRKKLACHILNTLGEKLDAQVSHTSPINPEAHEEMKDLLGFDDKVIVYLSLGNDLSYLRKNRLEIGSAIQEAIGAYYEK